MDRRLMAVAGVHAAVALAHGTTHQWADVGLATWQSGVVVATTLGPFTAAVLADRWPRASRHAFAGLLVGSVAFGVAHHWLLAGPDNVRTVPAPHHFAFEGTGVALAVVGAAGVVVAYSTSSR